jgi:hypothetical protein
MACKRLILLWLCFGGIITLNSCIDGDNLQPALNDQYSLAIPLIHSKLSVAKVAQNSPGNTSVFIAPDGKVTIIYKNNNVLTKNSAAIFPPFPGLIPFVIEDTVSSVVLPVSSGQIVRKAIFKDTKIYFYFESAEKSDITVKMRIPELTRNNVVFEREFKIINQNVLPVKWQTDQIALEGWEYKSQNNKLSFQYSAELSNGKKIKLDKALMYYNLINFTYVEGYLGYHSFPIDQNFIKVGLFNQWKSGTFDFENPKITLSVDNGFGIPVRSKVNKLELTSIFGKTVSLKSPFVTTGFDFGYPSLQEVGKLVSTQFEFNKNNSNIREVFNEKTQTISYDINALVNPDQNSALNGFITNESYFVVKIAVEVPLVGSVNQVVISDTVDLNLSEFDKVESAEFKAITSNDFPADIRVQAYFLDDGNKVIDQLFDGAGISLQAATLLATGITSQGKEKTDVFVFDQNRFAKIRNSRKMAITAHFNTTGSDQKKPLWIYDFYNIGVKLGVVFKYKP